MNSLNTYYTITPTLNTDWQPESASNNKIHKDAEITSNWKYRRYMQANAKNIMKTNTMQAIEDSGNNAYSISVPTNNSPLLYKSIYDNRTPRFGQNSDLKNSFITKQQNIAKMTSPSIVTM